MSNKKQNQPLQRLWLIVCSIIYRDKPSNDLTGQSERQKKNDDYNTDYYP